MCASNEGLQNLKNSINAEINNLISPDGDKSTERTLIDEAFHQIVQITGRGGSARAYGETKIIELVEGFKGSATETPWPIRKYLNELEQSS